MPGHESVAAIWKEFLLVGLFRIAEPPCGVDHEAVDRIMRTFDHDLNTVGLTCRVWVRWVLEVMRQPVLDSPSCPTVPPHVPIIRFDDVVALEAEAMAWGNERAQSTIDNVQPRPVGASKVSGCLQLESSYSDPAFPDPWDPWDP